MTPRTVTTGSTARQHHAEAGQLAGRHRQDGQSANPPSPGAGSHRREDGPARHQPPPQGAAPRTARHEAPTAKRRSEEPVSRSEQPTGRRRSEEPSSGIPVRRSEAPVRDRRDQQPGGGRDQEPVDGRRDKESGGGWRHEAALDARLDEGPDGGHTYDVPVEASLDEGPGGRRRYRAPGSRRYVAPVVPRRFASPSDWRRYAASGMQRGIEAAPGVLRRIEAAPDVLRRIDAPSVLRRIEAPDVLRRIEAPGSLRRYTAPPGRRRIEAPGGLRRYAAEGGLRGLEALRGLDVLDGLRRYQATDGGRRRQESARGRHEAPGSALQLTGNPRLAVTAALVAALVLGGGQASHALTNGGVGWTAAGSVTEAISWATGTESPPAPAGDPDEEAPAATDEAEEVASAPAAKESPREVRTPDSRTEAAEKGGQPSVEPTGSATIGPRAPTGKGPAGALTTTGSAGVALTFDDGPDPEHTPELLDLLREEQVKATFCVVGTEVRAHPELVRRIVEEGHALCNHSWDHDLKLGTRSVKEMELDLGLTNEAIRDAVPDAQISYFRAPGGSFTADLVTVAEENGMASIHWRVDPRDWDHPEDETDRQHIDRVVDAVLEDTKPGAIVLSHDRSQPLTITAYKRLIPKLQAKFDLIAMPTPE